jgi:hypothetical protein
MFVDAREQVGEPSLWIHAANATNKNPAGHAWGERSAGLTWGASGEATR